MTPVRSYVCKNAFSVMSRPSRPPPPPCTDRKQICSNFVVETDLGILTPRAHPIEGMEMNGRPDSGRGVLHEVRTRPVWVRPPPACHASESKSVDFSTFATSVSCYFFYNKRLLLSRGACSRFHSCREIYQSNESLNYVLMLARTK